MSHEFIVQLQSEPTRKPGAYWWRHHSNADAAATEELVAQPKYYLVLSVS